MAAAAVMDACAALGEKLHIALARRWRRWGDPWELAMRAAGRRAESDMVSDPAEAFYAAQYLAHIEEALPAGRLLDVLDAGCQAGRFTIPLARMGHRMTGIDISPDWLALCERHCRAAGVEAALMQGDIGEALGRFDAGSFDAILCTEVLYTLRDPVAALTAFRRLLRPGGVLVTSHRTRYYMLTTLARFHRFDEMAVAAGASEGELLGHYFNWFDEDELASRYAAAGLRIAHISGIGTLSGTGVDGTACIIDPARLDTAERAHLLQLERACAARYRDVARYRLLISHPCGELS